MTSPGEDVADEAVGRAAIPASWPGAVDDAIMNGDLLNASLDVNVLPNHICGSVGWAVASDVVSYELDDSSVVRFEIDRPAGFRPAGGAGRAAGRVQDAIVPVVEAAKVVLGKVREAAPDEVEVTFGVKVSGLADWVIARAASEANFEIKLTWRPGPPEGPAPAEASGGAVAGEPAPGGPGERS
jgi:hypothetical protein